jgi:SAM-dependent methyltransferase
MVDVTCYNCHSDRHAFYAEENGFTLVKCAGCGLLFVTPRPGESEILAAHRIGKHHGATSFDITGAFDESKIRPYVGVLGDIYNGSLGQNTAWLDIGCGHGEFMLAVQRCSQGRVAVEGIEPNQHKCASARTRRLDVYESDTAPPSGRYDVISLLNVYSHLTDPPASIAAWRRLLKPGGELLIQTGDTADLASEDHWRPFYLPDHLSFASEAIVCQVLDRCGFDIVSVHNYPLVTADPLTVIVEAAKAVRAAVLPRYRYATKWQYLSRHRLYDGRDMFIRARLRPGGDSPSPVRPS